MELAEKDLHTSISLKRILFATDSSCSSENAMPYAEDIARRYHSTIFVAHVISPQPLPITAAEAVDCTCTWQVLTECAERELNATGSRLRNLPHKLLLAYGEVAPTLVRLIEANDIDLVVVGTHGRRFFQRLLLGSVAEQIFRSSPVPVLTVGPQRVTAPGQLRSKHIVYAVKDPDSAIGAAYVRSLACEYGAHLVLLHVLPDGRVSSSWATSTKSVAAKLSELLPAESRQGYQVEYRVEVGEPAKTILRVGRETKAGLIVLDVHKSHFFTTHRAQDISYDVVCYAACPVLTLRM
jgi:nucleotide-binding universal stress UspA family protein